MYIYRNEKLMYMDKAKRQSLANTFIKEVLMFDDCILMIIAKIITMTMTKIKFMMTKIMRKTMI